MNFPAKFDLEFITPTFLVGADPGKAEMRAPSFRGQLRWWLRVIGHGEQLPDGLQAAEKRIFGGVHGEDRDPVSSAIQVRVKETNRISNLADLPKMHIGEPLYYLYYFAKVSGSVNNKSDGPRIKPGAFYSPGSGCQLQVTLRKALIPEDRQLLERALDAFLRLGTLGLRATRGCGAFFCKQLFFNNKDDLLNNWARSNSRTLAIKVLDGQPGKDWRTAQTIQAQFLKTFRKENHLSGRGQTALGSADPRLASMLHLRPVRVADGNILPALFYTDAPKPQNVPSVNKYFNQ